MSTAADITALPSMDDHKIGPGGQTFGDLKQAVLDARERFTRLGNQAALDELAEATRMLRAAYVRVGLPYVAP
jgi:hypothetical protein